MTDQKSWNITSFSTLKQMSQHLQSMDLPVDYWNIIPAPGADTLKDFLNIGSEGEDDHFWKNISKGSVVKQLAVGSLGGWCAGMAFARLGKVAAASVGGTILLFQILQHQGYIKVNWSLLKNDIEYVKKLLNRRQKTGFKRFYAEVEAFIEENIFLTSGFLGGFALGVASN